MDSLSKFNSAYREIIFEAKARTREDFDIDWKEARSKISSLSDSDKAIFLLFWIENSNSLSVKHKLENLIELKEEVGFESFLSKIQPAVKEALKHQRYDYFLGAGFEQSFYGWFKVNSKESQTEKKLYDISRFVESKAGQHLE